MEYVVLVDEFDNEIGTCEKLEAHEKALLHRALSVFVFNSKGQLLLQKRASSKYHSPGLWTNSCCSHPRPQESIEDAAIRRLREEMGMTVDLSHVFHFIYRAELEKGLVEHELDHVFVGHSDEAPTINRDEADDYTYRTIEEIQADIKHYPEKYTSWFKIIFDNYLNRLSALG